MPLVRTVSCAAMCASLILGPHAAARSQTLTTSTTTTLVTKSSTDITASAVTITYPSLSGTMANVPNGTIQVQLVRTNVDATGPAFRPAQSGDPGSSIYASAPLPSGKYHVRFTFHPQGTATVSIHPGLANTAAIATCSITSGAESCDAVISYLQSTSGFGVTATIDAGFPRFGSVYFAPMSSLP